MSIPASALKAGVDYPRDRGELGKLFPDEASCVAYLERLRWPDGFVCPQCGVVAAPWRSSRPVLVCPGCERQTSVLAGTILHRTRTPLRTWFLAAWLIANQRYGANASLLQRELGLKSYQTAWAWLHKFRRAMVRRDCLRGSVEVDESYVGGVERRVGRQQTEEKEIVAIAVEIVGDGRRGGFRIQRVPNCGPEALETFVKSVVEPGSSVLTDGSTAYGRLADRGYNHVVLNPRASPDPADVRMRHVRGVASLLDRWLVRTYRGGVSGKHLPYYLDEFTFRFDSRAPRARGLLFRRLLAQAVQVTPTKTADLYQATGRGRCSAVAGLERRK